MWYDGTRDRGFRSSAAPVYHEDASSSPQSPPDKPTHAHMNIGICFVSWPISLGCIRIKFVTLPPVHGPFSRNTLCNVKELFFFNFNAVIGLTRCFGAEQSPRDKRNDPGCTHATMMTTTRDRTFLECQTEITFSMARICIQLSSRTG